MLVRRVRIHKLILSCYSLVIVQLHAYESSFVNLLNFNMIIQILCHCFFCPKLECMSVVCPQQRFPANPDLQGYNIAVCKSLGEHTCFDGEDIKKKKKSFEAW